MAVADASIVEALSHSDEITVVAINCLKDWDDLHMRHFGWPIVLGVGY